MLQPPSFASADANLPRSNHRGRRPDRVSFALPSSGRAPRLPAHRRRRPSNAPVRTALAASMPGRAATGSAFAPVAAVRRAATSPARPSRGGANHAGMCALIRHASAQTRHNTLRGWREPPVAKVRMGPGSKTCPEYLLTFTLFSYNSVQRPWACTLKSGHSPAGA